MENVIQNCDVAFDKVFSLPARLETITELQYRQEIRAKILVAENYTKDMPQIEIETLHVMLDGSYARQIFIPKGALIVGRIHLQNHIVLISKGDVSVLSEFGVDRHTADNFPITFTSPKWIKRVIYAHEDTYWTNLHRVPDIEIKSQEEFDAIESGLFADNFDELDKIESTLMLE